MKTKGRSVDYVRANPLRRKGGPRLMPKTQHMDALRRAVVCVFGDIAAAPARDDEFAKTPGCAGYRAANPGLMGEHLQGIDHVFEQAICQRITRPGKKLFQPLQVGKRLVSQYYPRHVRTLWSWRAAAAWALCLDETPPAWKSNHAPQRVRGPYRLTACCAMRLQNLAETFRANRRAAWRQ